MMIYRWQSGDIVPDETLEAQLKVAEYPTIEDWLDNRYSVSPILEIGREWHSLWIRGYAAPDESCLVDVNLSGEDTMLIWCAHWGTMLACVKWLVDLATQAQRLNHEAEVSASMDALLGQTLVAPDVDAMARLIASGHTADEIEGLSRARARAAQQRQKDARTAG